MFEVFGLGAEFMFNASGTERIVQAVDQLEQLRVTANNSAQDMQNYNSALLEFSGAMVNTGATMMAKGIAQTMAAMNGVNDAAKWQTQMVNAVRYMSDSSAESQTKYNKQLSDTAKLLGKTKEEINESAVAYMMMGKDETTALQLAKNAGYAAVAWDMSAGSVADAFRTIKAAFNVNLEDQSMYQKYLDTINEVGNSTAATAADVVKYLSDGGSAIHNVANVTIEESMAMASAARFANMSLDEFATMTTRLGNNYNSGKLDEYFHNLGVETKTADGEMRSMADALFEVQKKWNDLDQATKATFASGAGGAFADRLSLYLGSGEEYAKAIDIANSSNSGSAEHEFNFATDTYESAIARFQVTLDDFKTAFWGTLLSPLQKFVEGVTAVVNVISNFMQAHPIIMKLASGFILLSGVALAVAGTLLVMGGLITKFATTLQGAYGPTALMQAALKGLGHALSSIAGPSKIAIKQLGKLTITMGVLYAAWKYDLFGIRTSLSEFAEKAQHTLSYVKMLLSDSTSVDVFAGQMQRLNNSTSIWDKLSLAVAKFGMVFKGVAMAWNDFTLSDSMYQKLQAAGVLDTVTFILLLKMKLEALFEGIKAGFTATMSKLAEFAQTVLKPPFDFLLNNIILPIAEAVLGAGNAIEVFCGKANSGMSEDILARWKALGEIIGSFAAFGLAGASIAKLVGVIAKVGGIVGTVIGSVMNVGGIITSVIGNIISAVGGVVGVIKGALAVVGAFLGIPAWAVGLIGVAIAGVVALVIKYRDEIFAFFQNFGTNIANIGQGIMDALSGIGQRLLEVPWINALVSAVRSAAELAVNGFITAFAGIAGFLYPIISTIKMLWQNFSGWIVPIWQQTVKNFSFVWGKITEFVRTIISSVSGLWESFTSGISSIRDKAIEVFTPVVQSIGGFVQSVITFAGTVATAVSNVLNSIVTFLQPIVAVIVAAWNIVAPIVGGVLNTILSLIMGAVSSILNVLTGVASAVLGLVVGLGTSLISIVSSIAAPIWDMIVSTVNGIIEVIGSALTMIFSTVSNVLMAISSFLQGNTEEAKAYLLNAWEAIKTGVSAIINGLWDIVKSIFSGILDTIISLGSSILEAVKAPFQSAYDWLSGFVENFFNIGSKIIDTIVSGINSVKDKVFGAINGVFQKASSLLPHSDAPEGPFSSLTASGKALVNTIASGIDSASGSVYNSMNKAFTDARQLLPFSDAKEGPFSNLTKSGMAIPSTLAAGIDKNASALYTSMSNASNTAMSAVENNAVIDVSGKVGNIDTSAIQSNVNIPASVDTSALQSSMKNMTFDNVGVGVQGYLKDMDTRILSEPMSAQLTETQNIVDTRAGNYYEAVLVRLDVITTALNSIRFDSTPSIADSYKQTNYERVNRVQEVQAEQKAYAEYNLNIQSGAIVINPQIVGGNADDAERIADLIREMMESEIFPYIMKEMERLKELKNTRG